MPKEYRLRYVSPRCFLHSPHTPTPPPAARKTPPAAPAASPPTPPAGPPAPAGRPRHREAHQAASTRPERGHALLDHQSWTPPDRTPEGSRAVNRRGGSAQVGLGQPPLQQLSAEAGFALSVAVGRRRSPGCGRWCLALGSASAVGLERDVTT
jgi:hypothetical protein